MHSSATIPQELRLGHGRGNTSSLVTSFVCAVVLANVALLAVASLGAGDATPGAALVTAGIAGLAASIVMTLWASRTVSGPVVAVLIAAPYVARVIAGVVAYIDLDPYYFEGPGTYHWGHPELELVYRSNVLVYEYLAHGLLGWAEAGEALNSGDTKNPAISWWSGLYLYALGTPHALNMAPFNAWHMTLAAFCIPVIAMQAGYSRQVAGIAGVVAAWSPYAFASSILWRDPIGIAAVFLAVALVSNVTQRGVAGIALLAVACTLAYAHRTVYPVVIVAVYLLQPARALRRMSVGGEGLGVVYITVIVASVLGTLALLFKDTLFLYYTSLSLADVARRVVYLPILALRAVLGPFPWFDPLTPPEFWERIFDYAFHVLQLSVIIAIIARWRAFFRNPDITVITFGLLLLLAMIAAGVHTSYLAVALPLAMPRAYSVGYRARIHIPVALVALLMANALFYSAGLSGAGVSQSITGY